MTAKHRFVRPALVIAPLVALLVAWPAAAAIHYEAVTTSDTPGRGKPTTIRVEAWVDGAEAKIEFRESGTPTMPAGTYLLTRNGGKTLYFVNPEEKTYAEWNLDQMLQTIGGLMQAMGPVLKFEVSDVEVEKLAEGPGESLHGLATTHYKYRTTYVMKIKVMGMGSTSAVDRMQDIWATRDLDDVALGIWLRNRPAATGLADLDELIAAEMGKVQGFPLKTVEVATTTGKKGKRESETRTTMEVTTFERNASVPASTYELPAGYTKTEIVPTAGPAEGQGDEAGGNPFKKTFGGG